VAPGGLLFLTMDFWDQPGPDRAHFHWMRKRIFNYGFERAIMEPLLDAGFFWLGDRDLTYHGPQVYDYTFASLALVKRS
jgi:hypothetical protein